MRHPFATELARSIKSSLTRFLAIVGIVGLGVGFYAGLSMSGHDMRESADVFYDGTSLYDLRVVSTLGLEEEQVEMIRSIEGVDQAVGGYAADIMTYLNGERYAMRIMSCDMDAARSAVADSRGATVESDDEGYLNRLVLETGDWPSAPNECVLSADRVMGEPIEVGDTVEVLYGTAALDDVLVYRTFTVSGLIHSSFYPSSVTLGYTNLGSGMIQQYMFVSPEAFSEELPYTEVFVTVDGARGLLTLDDDYQACVDEVAGRIEDMGLGELRLAQIKEDAEAELADAQQEYDEGKAEAEEELGNAADELADALAKLEEAERAIIDGQIDLEDGIAQLAAARAEAERQLAAGRAELEANERRLDDAEAQLGMTQADIDAARAELEENRSKLDDAEEQLGMTQADIDAAREELDAATAEWVDQRSQLVTARGDLVTVESALDALVDLAMLDGEPDEEQIADARAKVESAVAAARELYDSGLIDPESEEVRERIEELAGEIIAELENIDFDGDPEEIFEQLRAIIPSVAGKVDSAIDETVAQIDDGISQGDTAIAKAAYLLDQAQDARNQIDDGRRQLAEGSELLDQAQDARNQIDDGRRQLADGWRTYYEQAAQAEEQLASAQRTLDDAAAQLADARRQLEEGWEEYRDGLATYTGSRADVESRLADAAAQLEAARADIDALEVPSVYVLDRTMNAGVSSYNDDSHRIDRIAAVFPFIFFLVAALVSLTTMTRMVEDERIDIGTHKALGFSTARITAKYIAYATIAGVIGSVLGIAVLSQILPLVVQVAYAIIYNIPLLPFPFPVDTGIGITATLLGIGVVLLAIVGAAAATLREVPATLMLPRAPKPGKRILLERVGIIWQNLSFSWKVTCRNLFRYKRRLAMTVIGIAGCTGLLLTGLGLHDSIWDIIAYQYENDHPINKFNVIVGMDDDATEQDMDDVEAILANVGGADAFARFDLENMQASSDSYRGTSAIQVHVISDFDSYLGLIDLRTRADKQPLELDADAVILTEKMARRLGVDVGDTVIVYDQDEIGNATGKGYGFTVTGICENYVFHYLYVGADAWERAVGKPMDTDSILVHADPGDQARLDIAAALGDVDEVSTVVFNTETIDAYRKSLSSVNLVVVVLVLAAAALAFIVLYNLINIQLIERTREIASLKVLGFDRREVAAYLFRETILLVIVGALVGLALGVAMEGFVVVTAEVDAVMFGRDIHLPSFVIAFGVTLLFSFIVMAAIMPKLQRIDMVESLKSVD